MVTELNLTGEVSIESDLNGDLDIPIRGPQGPKGDRGDPGKDGKDGKDGRNGRDGKDGIFKLEELTPEQLESLKGPKGDKGDTYTLTSADKQSIAEQAADLVNVPTKPEDIGAASAEEVQRLSEEIVDLQNEKVGLIVQQTTAPTDTSVLWIDPTDNTSDGVAESADPLYQYVFKANITDGQFWYFDANVPLPYAYKYTNYSTVEPITLKAGTYCFSPLMLVYSWVKVGNNPVLRIDSYDSEANTSTPFTLTFPEETTVWLGYHNPQITAVTPYVVDGDEALPTGEYFEGKEPTGLDSLFDYGVFVESYIKNCELVANELSGENIGDAKGHYTGVKMEANIAKLMCKAKFFPNAAVALVTTSLGSRMVSDVTFGSVHLVFSESGCSVGVFDTKDHLRSVNYFSYAITMGEELAFGFDIDETTNTLTVYLPDGTTKTVTDSTISTLNGRYAILEHFSNTSEGAFASCRITKFYCKDANGEVLEDDFKRFDGAIGIAPTGQTYRQFTSHNGNNRDFK